MTRHIRIVFVLSLLALAAGAPSAAELPKITIVPAGHEGILRDEGFQVWTRQADFIVGAAPDAAVDRLSARGIVPVAQYDDDGQWMYLLHHRPGFVAPIALGAKIYALTPEIDLYLFPGEAKVELPNVKPFAGFQAIPRVPLPPLQTHPADLVAATSNRAPAAPNPLVQQILNATSQASWFQFVKDMSGENPVTIGGQPFTITTRWSNAMFPLSGIPQTNARATEYLEDRGAAWGYSSHRETYTSAQSGCSQNPWQNLIFIVPGQVDYGKHQQVLFVNHYDTISFSQSESLSYAPGADDAISGGGALFEAMRTFKDYGFKNTIVFAWFSGEEDGICGSGAYVRQHPSVDMWRVVNMDQTAYDGNNNGLMDVYNFDSINSPLSVQMGDTFVQANSDYGNIIPPANIVRDTSKMCQTDHCPFWDVGVPALAICEDLHNNDINPCFDQSQSPTCHDTVTQTVGGQLLFNQAFSWPTEKASIAVIAQLAEPLYACPAAPAQNPAATAGNNTVALAWDAASGVTNYVVERAATCAGPFDGIASVTGTSYEDVSAVNGNGYAYRIRTCPTQVSACVTASPAAAPSVKYQDGSAVVVADSGDHDNVPDDCELVTAHLTLVNDGNVLLNNVRLQSLTASSPIVRIAAGVPQAVPSLDVGQTAVLTFKFYVGRDGTSAACGDTLSFTATAQSDEAPAAARTFTLTAERSIVNGALNYGFESDFSGWTVLNGSAINRFAGGAPGSATASLHFTPSANGCAAIQSPIIKPSATSTMSAYVNYIIDTTGDRANMRAVDAKTGEKFLLTPTLAPYTVSGHRNLLCDNMGNVAGWNGSNATWRAANFDLSPYAGREIRLEARYSTDSNVGTQGFWMDFVQVSNAQQLNCDAGSNVCAALPSEVSPAGDPIPLTVAASGTDLNISFDVPAGAAAFSLYAGSLASLSQGIYDHVPLPNACTVPTLPGSTVVTMPSASVPDNSYVLAVARNTAGEGRYGVRTGGADVPLSLSACP